MHDSSAALGKEEVLLFTNTLILSFGLSSAEALDNTGVGWLSLALQSSEETFPCPKGADGRSVSSALEGRSVLPTSRQLGGHSGFLLSLSQASLSLPANSVSFCPSSKFQLHFALQAKEAKLSGSLVQKCLGCELSAQFLKASIASHITREAGSNGHHDDFPLFYGGEGQEWQVARGRSRWLIREPGWSGFGGQGSCLLS